MELFLRNWYDKLLVELSSTEKLRIISPFVTEQIIRNIKNKFNLENLELITRFKLSDFASGVSSLDGLKFAVEEGAMIFGIKNLHSKIYLFDNRAAIISSANLTTNGMFNNEECGIYLNDPNIIKKLHDHFEDLKYRAGNFLSIKQCKDWLQQIENIAIVNTPFPSLPDYGSTSIKIDQQRNYYIKFLGLSKGGRVPLAFTSREEIQRAFCHYACTFSKRPLEFQDGDIIYLSRMTYGPKDYAIFGKAEAVKFVEGRDIANEYEIMENPWKKTWPYYLRLKNPIFIDGQMGDCAMLYELMRSLSYESFPSTKERYESGERKIEPQKSLMQKAYVQLTVKAVEWLEPRFQAVLNRKGKVDEAFIKTLPQSSIKINI